MAKKASKVSAIKKKGVMKSKAKPKAGKGKPKAPAKKKGAATRLREQRARMASGTRTADGSKKTTLKDIKKKQGGLGKTLKSSIKSSLGLKARSTRANDRAVDRRRANADHRGTAGGTKRKVIGKLKQTGEYRDRFGGGNKGYGNKSRKPSRMVGTGSRSKVGSHRKKN